MDYTHKKQELEQSNNPFSIIIAAHLASLETVQGDEQRLQLKLQITRMLYARGLGEEEVLDMLSFIDWVLTLSKPLALEYEQYIDQLEEEKRMHYITSFERRGIEKGLTIGRAEGRQEGRQEGERTLFIHLLQSRFGKLPRHIRTRLEKASEEQLLCWSERFVKAKILNDIFDEKHVMSRASQK